MKKDIKRYVEQAREIQGIDEEIAVLRAKFKSLLNDDKQNIKVILQATETLGRLLHTKIKLSLADKQGLKEGLTTIIKEIGEPLGVDLTKTIFK